VEQKEAYDIGSFFGKQIVVTRVCLFKVSVAQSVILHNMRRKQLACFLNAGIISVFSLNLRAEIIVPCSA